MPGTHLRIIGVGACRRTSLILYLAPNVGPEDLPFKDDPFPNYGAVAPSDFRMPLFLGGKFLVVPFPPDPRAEVGDVVVRLGAVHVEVLLLLRVDDHVRLYLGNTEKGPLGRGWCCSRMLPGASVPGASMRESRDEREARSGGPVSGAFAPDPVEVGGLASPRGTAIPAFPFGSLLSQPLFLGAWRKLALLSPAP